MSLDRTAPVASRHVGLVDAASTHRCSCRMCRWRLCRTGPRSS